MRCPTRWERFVFRVLRRWPESYVEARLLWLDQYDRYAETLVATLGPVEAFRVIREARS